MSRGEIEREEGRMRRNSGRILNATKFSLEISGGMRQYKEKREIKGKEREKGGEKRKKKYCRNTNKKMWS